MDSKKPRLPEGWRVCRSKTYPDRTYYFNINTGSTCWNFEEITALTPAHGVIRPKKRLSSRDGSLPPHKGSERPVSRSQTGQKRKHDDSKTLKLNKVKKTNSASSGYGNSIGSPAAVSSSSEMEVCEAEFEDDAVVMTEIEELRQNYKSPIDIMQSPLLKSFARMNETPMHDSGNSQTLYIVVDTNVLLTSLKLLDHLTLLNRGESQFTFVIPWMVLQELDKLKENRNETKTLQVCKQAQAAIRYIHAQLKDPTSFIRGQSIDEALKKTDFEPKNNDDHILLCCLAFKKKANSTAIILSNDKNLCNKAHSSNCTAYTADEIEEGITKQLKELGNGANSSSAIIYEEIRGRVVSDSYKSFKSTLFRILSSVLEKTMILVYDLDKWKAVVKIKPPWGMIDVFSCFKKHQIAIFSNIFGRDDEEILDALKEFFQNDKGRSGDLRDLISNIENSISLCVRLQQKQVDKALSLKPTPSPFEPQLSLLIDEMCSLREECKKYYKNVEHLKNEVKSKSNGIGPVLPKSQNWDHMDVMNLFKTVGEEIRLSCAIIGTALNIQHSYTLPSEFSQPTETIEAKLRSELELINNLGVALSKVLSGNDELKLNCIELCGALKAFFPKDQKISNFFEGFSPDILYLFCSNSENRQHLQKGCIEIETHFVFLQTCRQVLTECN